MRFYYAMRLAILGRSPEPLGEQSLRSKFLATAFARTTTTLWSAPGAFWAEASSYTASKFWSHFGAHVKSALLFTVLLAVLTLTEAYFFFTFSSVSTLLFQNCNLLALFIAWAVTHAFSYLLFVGFASFLTRLGFTFSLPALARFWRRSFGVFWMLEGFLFVAFTYLYLNSSQEIWYVKDSTGAFKTQHFAVPSWLFKLSFLCLLMALTWGAGLLVEIGELSSPRSLLVTATLLLFCLFEVSSFFNLTQSLASCDVIQATEDTALSLEARRSRVAQHFLFICSLAKFYHLAAVALAWFVVFPAVGSNKADQVGVVSFCSQNLTAIYALTWLGMAPYAKYLYISHLEQLATLWSFSHLPKNLGLAITSVVDLVNSVAYLCF